MALTEAKVYYDRVNDEVIVDVPYHYKDLCKSLKSKRWDKETQTWRVPTNIPALEDLLIKFTDRAEIDPRVHQVLEKKRGESWIFFALKDKNDLRPEDASYKFHTQPFPHQVSGTEAILRRNKVLLLDQMGLGKSKQMIDAAVERMRRGQIVRGIVICPSSLKWNWKNEIMLHAPEGFRRVVVIDGDRKKRDAQWKEASQEKAQWIIINYESARIHPAEMARASKGQMLMADEAHKIKNMKAAATKVVHAIAPAVPYIVLATGTPIANKPEDVYSLTQLVEPGLLGSSLWAFLDNYTVKGGFEGRQIVGYQNLGEFRKRLNTVSIRRLKEQVMDMPPKTYERRDVVMADDQLREYRRMQEDMVALYKEMPERDFRLKAVNVQSQLLRLQQIADGFLQSGDHKAAWFNTQPKMAALEEIADEILYGDPLADIPPGKLVIWSRFLAVTAMLEEKYKKHGAVRIYGDVPTQERFALVDRFQTDPSCRVLIGQVHTAGLGLNMTAAQTQVFYDRWWSPSVNEQAEDRLHRIGQRGTVTVVTLAAKDSIDERVMQMLENKKEWSDVITGDDLRLNKRAVMMLLGEEVNEDGENKDRGTAKQRVVKPRKSVEGVRPAGRGGGKAQVGVRGGKAKPRVVRTKAAR